MHQTIHNMRIYTEIFGSIKRNPGVGGCSVPGSAAPPTAYPKCGAPPPPRVGGLPSYAFVQGTITLSHTFPAVVRDNMEPLITRRGL